MLKIKYTYTAILFSALIISGFQNSALSQFKKIEFKKNKIEKTTSSVLPISIGVLTSIYLINPILEYTDRKLYLGLTKEISVGWGKFGEHRTAFEYSMIFGGNIRNYISSIFSIYYILIIFYSL